MDSQVGVMLRALREDRKLSVRTLAARAGFSSSFISQVETGQASPSIASLEKIAGVLSVTLAEFFSAGDARGSGVVRANERPKLESGWSKARIESLAVKRIGVLEPVVITLAAGGMSGKHLHTLVREQFAYVVSGEVVLALDETDHLLSVGDSVSIAPQQPYRWINASDGPVQILVVSARK